MQQFIRLEPGVLGGYFVQAGRQGYKVVPIIIGCKGSFELHTLVLDYYLSPGHNGAGGVSYKTRKSMLRRIVRTPEWGERA